MSQDDARRETWPEHDAVNRYAPLGLLLLGVVLLVVGLLDHRDPVAAIGFVAVLGGVVLPRVSGRFEVGPGGVKAQIEPVGPTRVTVKNLPPGSHAEAHVETVLPSGEVAGYVESVESDETIEVWGGRVLRTSVGQQDWWVTFRGPELSEAGWEALRAAPDMVWVSRSGGAISGALEEMPEPSSWRYRVAVKAKDADQAISKVHGVLEPHETLFDWEAQPVEEHLKGSA